jgi:hypothetical protein
VAAGLAAETFLATGLAAAAFLIIGLAAVFLVAAVGLAAAGLAVLAGDAFLPDGDLALAATFVAATFFLIIGLAATAGAAATTADEGTVVLTVFGIFGFTIFLMFFLGLEVSVLADLTVFGLAAFGLTNLAGLLSTLAAFLAATLAFLVASFSAVLAFSPNLNEPFDPVPVACLKVPSFKPKARNFLIRLLAITGSILKLALMYLISAIRDEPERSLSFFKASVIIDDLKTGPAGAVLAAFGTLGLATFGLATLDGAGVDVASTGVAATLAATGDAVTGDILLEMIEYF